MAYSEQLASRIRAVLSDVPKVEEKRMFGGLAFMVDHKMCITAGANRIMCRIDPALHEEAISRPGCTTVIMRGREYKGYVHIAGQVIKTKDDLHYWIELALDYNKTAKPSKR